MSLKKMVLAVLGVFLLSTVCAAAPVRELKDEQSRINYSIGYQIGGDFRKQGWTLDPELLVQGIRDALANAAPLLSSEQMNATLVSLKKKLTSDQLADRKRKDTAFLAEHAGKKGVTVLPDGVQYLVIKEGSGKKPALKDSVTIRYHVNRAGEHDSSAGRPDSPPKTYPLKKALPGLQEVLQLMKEGSVWQVVLPPQRAEGGKGETLEHVGVLVYTLELVAVTSSGPAAQR